jgi:hypothetical protein
MSAEHLDRYSQMVRNFAFTTEFDALTAKVAGAFVVRVLTPSCSRARLRFVMAS